MHRLLVMLGLIGSLAALTACSSSASSTQVVLDVTYQDSWGLTRFDYEVASREASSQVARRVTVFIPEALIGQSVELEVWGLRADTRYAHGQVTVTPVRDQTVHATLTMSRVPCGAWCTLGAQTCQGDAMVTCEQLDDDGCYEWSMATACPEDAPYCSLGSCSATCTDECASGETRCDGPGGLRVCGQGDSDGCLDWLPAVACGEGETCANGACTTSCQDECAAGATACQGDGTMTCGDLDGDGCREWGPAVPCGSGQTCSAGVCSSACTDECTADRCDGNVSHTCGQFDGDSCKDLSPGTSCIPADPCQEGACTGGACETAPKVCDQPPAAACLDDHTKRVYQAQGTCSSSDGTCDYAYEDRECASCPACDPCVGVTCNAPPAPAACYAAAGTCGSDGSCSYAYADGHTCDDGNACTTADSCDTGACSGTPKVCADPPAPTCVNDTTLRTFAASGTCSAGACTYGHTDTTCAAGCQAGACAQASRWVAIAAGYDHACAVHSDGHLACWGNASLGATTPPGGSFKMTAQSISGGARFSCAIRSDSAVVCWGDPSVDELLAPPGAFTSVSTGGGQGCAIQTDGAMACWGWDGNGEADAPAGTFSFVSAGSTHTCAVQTDGAVVCWGDDAVGEASPPGGSFVEVAAGQHFSCARTAGGALSCWGDDTFGRTSPPDGTFAAISLGSLHACGLRTDGTIVCWGDDVDGAATPPEGTYSAVSAGAYFTCGLRTDGTIVCWGNDDEHQLEAPAP
jgi:hypothetical protein